VRGSHERRVAVAGAIDHVGILRRTRWARTGEDVRVEGHRLRDGRLGRAYPRVVFAPFT
jgi:hypothetical protein